MSARRRHALLGVLVSGVVGLALLALAAVGATTSRLAQNERAALVTAQDVIAVLDEELPRVQDHVARRRTRGGGVELSYDGLSPRALRVKSWVRLEATPELALRTWQSWLKDGLPNAGFEPDAWATEPCEGRLELGDEASCRVLLTEGQRAGNLVVVRSQERLLVLLTIGVSFTGEDLRALMAPHLEATLALKPLAIFD